MNEKVKIKVIAIAVNKKIQNHISGHNNIK